MTAPASNNMRPAVNSLSDLGSLPQSVNEAASRLMAGKDLLSNLGYHLAFSQSVGQKLLWAEAGFKKAEGNRQQAAVAALATRYGVNLGSDGRATLTSLQGSAKTHPAPQDSVTSARTPTTDSTALLRAASQPPSRKAHEGLSKETAISDLNELIDRRLTRANMGDAMGSDRGWHLLVLGRLTPAEVRQAVEKKVGPAQAEMLYQEIAHAGAQRFVHTVGHEIRKTLRASEVSIERLLADAGARTAWLGTMGTEAERVDALSGLGLERQTATAIARDPVARNADLVSGLQRCGNLIQSIQRDTHSSSFSSDVALRMLQEHPLAESAIKRAFEIERGSCLDEALGHLKAEGASLRRQKSIGKAAVTFVAGVATMALLPGVAAPLWVKAVASPLAQAGTSVLRNVPELVGLRLGEKQARVAVAHGLATDDTSRRATEATRDGKVRMAFDAIASFAGGSIGAIGRHWGQGYIPTDLLGDALEFSVGSGATEAIKHSVDIGRR